MNFSTGLWFMTALSVMMGLSLWAALWYRNRLAAWSFEQLVLIIFGLGLACRVVFVVVTPTFYAPDEEPHFNFIKFLYEHQTLPVQTSQTEAASKDWEYYQPPLYYLVSVPVYALTSSGLDSRHFFLVRAIRPLSVVCWALNVFFALQILKNLKLEHGFVGLFVISMVCLLPTYTFLSASINNDNLVITLGGAVLWLLSRQPSYRQSLTIGILLGLAFLTKLTAIVYLVAVVGQFVAQVIRKAWPVSTALVHFGLIGLPVASLFSPWLLRNLKVYGQLYPEEIANVPAKWASSYEAFTTVSSRIQDTFWSTAGIHNNIMFVPQVGVLLTYVAVMGLLYGVWARRHILFLHWPSESGSFLLGTGIAIGVNLLLALRFGLLYNQGQGRFLFPLLIPLAIFLALGLKWWGLQTPSKNLHIHLIGFFVVYLCGFMAYTLVYLMKIWL